LIRNDLSHLPAPAEDTQRGEPPDPQPRFAHLLGAATARDSTPPAAGLRTGDAGKCARAIGYRAAGIERTNPVDPAGHWVHTIDRLLRVTWRDALLAEHPDAQVNERLTLDAGGVELVGWADAIIDTNRPLTPVEEADLFTNAPMDVIDAAVSDGLAHPEGDIEITHRVLVTLHAAGGFAYKSRIGERGDPEGPSVAHKLEAALLGLAAGADEIVVGYLATEVVARWAAEKMGLDEAGRYAAEWTYPRETFVPWAEAELARLRGVIALGRDDGLLPARKIPGLPNGSVIVDPSTGRWEQRARDDGRVLDTATTWQCLYCSWRDLCATTTAGRIPLSAVQVELDGVA
jgi:hypothetical protein